MPPMSLAFFRVVIPLVVRLCKSNSTTSREMLGQCKFTHKPHRANLVTSTLSSCPNTKVVMSGYSQGGQLVHKAAKLLPAETTAKVSSAVIFGDPGLYFRTLLTNFCVKLTICYFIDNGQSVQGIAASKTDIICHFGDNICQGGAMILYPHLTYGMDVGSAASFIKSAAGF
jgi:cutinase